MWSTSTTTASRSPTRSAPRSSTGATSTSRSTATAGRASGSPMCCRTRRSASTSESPTSGNPQQPAVLAERDPPAAGAPAADRGGAVEEDPAEVIGLLRALEHDQVLFLQGVPKVLRRFADGLESK